MCVWGCPSKVRVYNPQENKLDPRTISGHFIGYAERYKGYIFHCPSHSIRIMESRNAKFHENDLISGRIGSLSERSELEQSNPQPSTSSHSQTIVVHHTLLVRVHVERPVPRTPQIADDDLVDPIQQMSDIDEHPVEQHVPPKDVDVILRSTRFNLELQQMDVKTAFLNGNLEEEVYMKQPEGFSSSNDMGDASYVIGIKIHRDRHKGVLGLSQEIYINKVLERFWMKDCSPNVAPVVKGDRFNLNQCLKNEFEREQIKNISYASAVGSLIYQSNPGIDHWRAAKKVIRYLQGMKDYMLMYRHSDNLEVIGFSDSNFVGCVDSRKSTSGYIFMLAGGAISWRSAKQTMTNTSTMEAEFISCFEASSHGIWLKSFISGLRLLDSIFRPIKIYCDNSAAMFMTKNNKSEIRSKHIDIKYLAIRERVKDMKVIIEHINTELMLADPLTKGMPPYKFKDHVIIMGLGSILEICKATASVPIPCSQHSNYSSLLIFELFRIGRGLWK
ncbi:hypothetical protein VNO77_31533 [Canavalia gladiata]|uniref:Retrovirus-related Pol polyprotein from transposon TNT 1-94 n=1 Tax=Canavalia gladiata TaxID=3824 RepID=A0AAN9KSQ9_CANGL